jgi:hypothetical protein
VFQFKVSKVGAHAHWPPANLPTNQPKLASSSKHAWKTFSRPNRIFSAGATLGKKEKKKAQKKKQNSKTLNPQPVESFFILCYTEKTGGLQHCQMPDPNLPKRQRQTGLDAKGVTPELLRLKFYCS